MAWTKFDNKEEKKRLQDRALALKPRVAGVIATELGWALPTVKDTLEILVRYDNLDSLLGDEISEVELVGEPIVITPEVVAEEVKIEAPIETVAEPVVKEELKVEETKPAPKKPGPKKKAAEE